jgi:hypothetical protein
VKPRARVAKRWHRDEPRDREHPKPEQLRLH